MHYRIQRAFSSRARVLGFFLLGIVVRVCVDTRFTTPSASGQNSFPPHVLPRASRVPRIRSCIVTNTGFFHGFFAHLHRGGTQQRCQRHRCTWSVETRVETDGYSIVLLVLRLAPVRVLGIHRRPINCNSAARRCHRSAVRVASSLATARVGPPDELAPKLPLEYTWMCNYGAT